MSNEKENEEVDLDFLRQLAEKEISESVFVLNWLTEYEDVLRQSSRFTSWASRMAVWDANREGANLTEKELIEAKSVLRRGTELRGIVVRLIGVIDAYKRFRTEQ